MLRNLTKVIVLLFGILFWSAITLLNAQQLESIFDRMSYKEVLDISITTNLDALDERHSSQKLQGILSFTDADNVYQEWKVKLGIRGKFRRIRCPELPPLRLDFNKKELKAAGLAVYDDMKVVNQCHKKRGKELLQREYLAYKLYNELTDDSFRVQFLNITYVDSLTGEKVKQRGFIIEDLAQLGARIGSINAIKQSAFTLDQFDPQQFQTMALFQYLIGNADWSVNPCRNVKVLERGDHYIAVPYDFDFSGMVNAGYAIPNPNYALTSVKQRIYLGFTREVPPLEPTINHFVGRKSMINEIVKNCDLLTKRNRKRIRSYLKTYFKRPKSIAFVRD